MRGHAPPQIPKCPGRVLSFAWAVPLPQKIRLQVAETMPEGPGTLLDFSYPRLEIQAGFHVGCFPVRLHCFWFLPCLIKAYSILFVPIPSCHAPKGLLGVPLPPLGPWWP